MDTPFKAAPDVILEGLRITTLVDSAQERDWLPGALAQLAVAGAVVETTEDPAGAGNADIVLATTPALGRAARAAGVERFVLWTLVQEDPASPLTLVRARAADVAAAVADSRRVLVFDEASRSTLESFVWNAAGKTLVLPRLSRVEWEPPAVPAADAPESGAVLVVNATILGSSRVDELMRYADRVRPHRTPPDLLVVAEGDEAIAVRTDPALRHLVAIPGARLIGDGAALVKAMAGRVGVCVLPDCPPDGADRREDALAWSRAHGFAAWSGSAGAPPRVGGHGLPVLTSPTPEEALAEAAGLAGRLSPARVNRTAALVQSQVANPGSVPLRDGAPLKVLLVGADYKFLGDLVEAMLQRPDLEIRVDQWKTNGDRPTPQSQGLIAWADVVVTEFASRNAIWASRNVREDQRLILHLHGYELRNPIIHDVDIDRVETVVFVSEFYRATGLATTGWPAEKTVVIANSVQAAELARPKHPDARFHLGVAGYVPELKRLDRAVELLRELRREDDRYVLHLRGRHPWNYKYVWGRPLRRDAYLAVYEQLRADPDLRRAVVFDPFGPDMGNWYRQIGWALSPSARETFHLAPVEGMVSGALPIVWEREGAAEIFPAEAIVRDASQAAVRVRALAEDPAAHAVAVQRTVDFAARYEAGAVVDRWLGLILHGMVPPSFSAPVDPETVAPVAEAASGRADWSEIGSLVEAGLFGPAQSAAEEEHRPEWRLPEEDRYTAAVVAGYPSLGQRVHTLVGHPAPTPLPGTRPPRASSLLLLDAESFPRLRAGEARLIVGAARGDLDAHVSAVVDRVVRRALDVQAGRIRVSGNEVLALAGAAAAGWLGLPLEWDLASDAEVDLLETARRCPDDPDPRVRIALNAASVAATVRGPRGDELPGVPAPLERRTGQPALVRPRVIGVVGAPSEAGPPRPDCTVRELTPRTWEEASTAVDVALIDLAAARRRGWELDRGDRGALGRMITALRRRGVPLAIMDAHMEGLDASALAAARRVDAVLAASADDVQRLHDRRILPAQVAVSLASWGGVGIGEEPLVDAEARTELALRMLRVPRAS